MKKRNLKLADLKVNSFTTSSIEKIRGGERSYNITNNFECGGETNPNNCVVPISNGQCDTVVPGQAGICADPFG